MTPQQARELLPIITAFASGETLEFLNNNGKWEETKDVRFCLEPDSYRIKPKTKKCRIALLNDNSLSSPWVTIVPEHQYKEYEKYQYFVKWLTEEIEYPEKI